MKKAFLSAIVACAVSVSGFAQQRIITYVNGKSTIFTLGSQPKLQELGSAVMEFMYDYHYLKEWTLTEDIKEVLGYKCRSAKCSFRGREWTAYNKVCYAHALHTL